jgi:hypothetical protein
MALPQSANPIDVMLAGQDGKAIPEFLQTTAKTVLAKLQAKAREKSINADSAVDVRKKFAQRIADVLISKIDLASMKSADAVETKTAVQVLVDVMKQEREAAEQKMHDKADFFEAPFYTQTDVYKDGIKRPSDLGQFLCTEYLSRTGLKSFDHLEEIHKQLNLPTGDKGLAAKAKSAGMGVAQGLVLLLLTNTDAQDKAVASFDLP